MILIWHAMQNQIKQDYINENYPITVLEDTQYTVKQWLELQRLYN